MSRRWRQRVADLCMRVGVILLVTALIIALPEPSGDSVVRYKNAVTALACVVLLGKTLFDTFFYDHFSR